MNELPLVSICCITYNQARFIGQCMNGFLVQQTSFPVEILVFDDASTDGAQDILLSFASKDNRIRLFLQTENQWAKRRYGFIDWLIPAARGKYIALCEGDDYWTDPLKLQRQVDFLEANPGFVISSENCLIKDEINNTDYVFSKEATRELFLQDLLDRRKFSTASVVFKNVQLPLKIIDGFMDTNLWCYLTKFGRVHFSDRISSVYRRHSGGVTKSGTKLAWIKNVVKSTRALKFSHPELDSKKLFERNAREYRSAIRYFEEKKNQILVFRLRFLFFFKKMKFELFGAL